MFLCGWTMVEAFNFFVIIGSYFFLQVVFISCRKAKKLCFLRVAYRLTVGHLLFSIATFKSKHCKARFNFKNCNRKIQAATVSTKAVTKNKSTLLNGMQLKRRTKKVTAAASKKNKGFKPSSNPTAIKIKKPKTEKN